MPRPKKSDDEKVIRQDFSIDRETLARLLSYCQKTEQSMSSVIRQAVNRFLDEEQK